MANKIVLAWSVSVAGSSRSPAQAAAALQAIQLYVDPTTDPVLGQLFGVTVADDTTIPTPGGAKRTLTLNMTSAAGAPFAPPPFPCQPNTLTPPTLPYLLTTTQGLIGSFFVRNGSLIVPTTESQLTALVPNAVVQFGLQPTVSYDVANITAAGINLSIFNPYTGPTGNSTAVLVELAPVVDAAFYSTSPLDTASGSGAQAVSLSYLDSTGAAGTVVVPLAGKFPVPVPLAAGTIDIETITDLHVAAVGGFGNSVGQITLSELTDPIVVLGPADSDDQDSAQMKLGAPLVYLPPSYFALAQQGASAPPLAGDFFVSTGSTSVPTDVSQVGILLPGSSIQFASQLAILTPSGAVPVIYVVEGVGPSLVTLRTPYTGTTVPFMNQSGTGTLGTEGAKVIEMATAATFVNPPGASPTNAQLAAPLAQFVDPGITIPPTTMFPSPTFLSDIFSRTISLALAVPVTPSPIAIV
jgi:hypothetical protein